MDGGPSDARERGPAEDGLDEDPFVQLAAAVQFCGGDGLAVLHARDEVDIRLIDAITARVMKHQADRDRQLAGMIIEELAKALERGKKRGK